LDTGILGSGVVGDALYNVCGAGQALERLEDRFEGVISTSLTLILPLRS
jgi:hypothetical protein